MSQTHILLVTVRICLQFVFVCYHFAHHCWYSPINQWLNLTRFAKFCTFRIGAGIIKWFWLIYSLILMIVTSYGFLCMILFGTCSVNFSHLLSLIIVWYWLCGMMMLQFNVTDLFPDKKTNMFFVFQTKSVAGIWQGSTCCICTVCVNMCLQRLRQLGAAAADLWLFY